jgi:epoxyqueuosine reductase
LVGDASPLVRGAAVWALSRLMARDEFYELARTHAPAEHDPSVAEEWQTAFL